MRISEAGFKRNMFISIICGVGDGKETALYGTQG